MPFGVLAFRVTWIAAFLFSLASSSPATAQQNLPVTASAAAAADTSLLAPNSASFDKRKDEPAAAEQTQSLQRTTAATDQPQFVIEHIDFTGNRRIRTDTLKARIFSREGDPYNEETLRRDFQALWNTQFFEDVKLKVEDSGDRPDGKIIVFEVKERPQIRRIRYEGNHSISESDILDRFKERKVGLSVESPFDPTKIKKAEVVLKELLGEHGRQFAKVTPQYERIASSNAVILIFKIDEGPKVKVGRIKFVGNHAFSDRKLLRAMKHDRPYGIPLYFFDIAVLSKTYDREKLDEDLEVGIRGLYQDNGYFRVVVAPNGPVLENVDVPHKGAPLPGMKAHVGKAVNITINIEEGERYHMGTLKIVSSDPDKALSLKVEALKTIFPMKEGDILNVDKLRKALKNYTDAYGQYGFIDFTAEPDFDIDEANKKINVILHFDEQKQYYVRRINFIGNTTTRDKVIRRELLIDEGQLFDKRRWDISILRLNQLNYFDKIEADKSVELAKNTKDGTVDINLKLHEKGKQSIGLQGGVSYQTNNFLGLGETLTLSAQFGEIQRTLQFGFTEPYLFDRPISSGFTVFSSKYNFNQARQEALLTGQQVAVNPQYVQNYDQDSTGFTAFLSYPVKRFSFARLGLTYGLTRTNITAFNAASSLLFEQLQFRSIVGPSALNGIISSAITPSISYNTINNPINATSGKSIYYAFSLQGGPLGGNVDTISTSSTSNISIPSTRSATPSACITPPRISPLMATLTPTARTSRTLPALAPPASFLAPLPTKFPPSAAITWAAKTIFADLIFVPSLPWSSFPPSLIRRSIITRTARSILSACPSWHTPRLCPAPTIRPPATSNTAFPLWAAMPPCPFFSTQARTEFSIPVPCSSISPASQTSSRRFPVPRFPGNSPFIPEPISS